MTHLTPEQIDAILAHQQEPDELPTDWLCPEASPIPLNVEADGWELIYAELL